MYEFQDLEAEKRKINLIEISVFIPNLLIRIKKWKGKNWNKLNLC